MIAVPEEERITYETFRDKPDILEGMIESEGLDVVRAMAVDLPWLQDLIERREVERRNPTRCWHESLLFSEEEYRDDCVVHTAKCAACGEICWCAIRLPRRLPGPESAVFDTARRMAHTAIRRRFWQDRRLTDVAG